MGVRIARKHVAWYLQGLFGEQDSTGVEYRRRFNALEDTAEQLHFIEHFFPSSKHEDLAA